VALGRETLASRRKEDPRVGDRGAGAASAIVVDGDELAADPQRVEDQAADLDLVIAAEERLEQRAQVLHAAVVDPS
jgi:hypothetical protein